MNLLGRAGLQITIAVLFCTQLLLLYCSSCLLSHGFRILFYYIAVSCRLPPTPPFDVLFKRFRTSLTFYRAITFDVGETSEAASRSRIPMKQYP
ncbi:hypothetical protein F5Y09DRAFT_323346 [Xylaria sp. FL1042]|nr:hypothetical protein F5Y09DRAFT_323346 [Xylaria sp. FL1042]